MTVALTGTTTVTRLTRTTLTAPAHRILTTRARCARYAAAAMEFRLLGAFDALHEGRQVLVGSRRQERCLLAILLLHPDQVVSTARLIDLLWDGTPPPSAQGTVHTYVGRLRAALRPYGVCLDTRHEGYVVALETGQHTVDVGTFTSLSRQATATHDPASRLRLLEHAHALWRGPLLADVADDRLRDRLGGPALLDTRLTAHEQHAEAALALGQHERVTGQLGPLLDQHPTRERLVTAQMTALYRAGRRAEALDLYRATHHTLADQLGIQPSPALRALHSRVLRADPDLERPAIPTYAVRVDDQWLPWTAAGHPALEFCNTYAGWAGPPQPRGEWLATYGTLLSWARYHDLVDPPLANSLRRQARCRAEEAEGQLRAARQFRALLRACLVAQDARAFKEVAKAAQRAYRYAEFVRDEDGLGHWRLTSAAGLRLPLLAVARSAADLLAAPGHLTVSACQSPSCGWLFLDSARRRRWCGLATCGDHTPPTPARQV